MTTQEEWDTITYNAYPKRKFLVTIKRVDNSYGCFIGVNIGSIYGICDIAGATYSITIICGTAAGFKLQKVIRVSDNTDQTGVFEMCIRDSLHIVSS